MKYLLFLLSFVTVFGSQAQTISFEAPLKDTTVYLARYFGSKMYYADTAEVVNGKFAFDAARHPGGLYAVLLPNAKRFDIIIDGGEAPVFNLKNPNDPIGSMEVKNSANNVAFFEYMAYMNKKRGEGKVIAEKMKAAGDNKELLDGFRAQLTAINAEVLAYQKEVVKTHPNQFVGIMIDMTLDAELPDHPRDENGVITDSNFVFHYYVAHYWDGVDLRDARIVNTPVFHNKLDKYFSRKGILQVPDTICYYAKQLIDKTDKIDQSNKVFQYIVHHITNKYETSEIMGMDKVFCYMATNYYCPPNKLAYWMDDANTTKVCERAEKVCRTVIGNIAIPIILPDSTQRNWVNLHQIAAKYTVLYFWDPNCGHCKKITPKLQTLYEKKFKARSVEVYAVGKATGHEFDKWKEYIRTNKLSFTNVGLTDSIYNVATADDQAGLTNLLRNYTTLQSLNYADTYDVYSTPRIFILDEEKRIMYKQISIGQLEEIIDRLTGHASDEKLFPKEAPENGMEPEDH